MLRRLVLLLLVLVLPAQALAGAFVHVCRHDLAAAAPAIQAAPAGGHEHCPMSVDAAGPAAMPDAAPAALKGPAEILARAEWAQVDAVKNNRVYYIDPALITRAGPRIIDGINALYTALYESRQPELP